MKSYDNPMNPITRSYKKTPHFVWPDWNVEIPYIHHGFVSVVFNMNGGRWKGLISDFFWGTKRPVNLTWSDLQVMSLTQVWLPPATSDELKGVAT